MPKKLSVVMTAALLMGFAAPVMAQQQDTAIDRLQKQIDALTREIEAMRLGDDVIVRADTAQFGLGPAASKVYRVRQGVSLGGYGEVLYENFAKERENESRTGLPRDQIDALRLILYVGYKFSDKLLFNSEIEFEHGSTGQGGEASVEFAYVDYLATPAFGLRAGMVLVPMGLTNELHEPPIFLGTTRPLTETNIIPTTWRENGAGVFGGIGDFSYRAYVINGFDAVGGPTSPSRASGFSAAGLRGGRQKGARALIENPALVGRIDYAPGLLPGLQLGLSAYTGNSAQLDSVEIHTSIVEVHGQFNAHGFDLRGLYAEADVDNTETLNRLRNLTGTNAVGESMKGWYVQAGYDVLRLTRSEMQLMPYVRLESLNTQQRPGDIQINPANERSVTVVGAQFKPIPNVVLKADYQLHKNEAETGLNQFNIALGYLF